MHLLLAGSEIQLTEQPWESGLLEISLCVQIMKDFDCAQQ